MAPRSMRLAREMCDRHTGIGADGLIVFERTDTGAAMRLFNADGSRAEVSGNGVRALAALLLRDDMRPSAEVIVQTEAGVKHLMRTEQSVERQTFRAEWARRSTFGRCRFRRRGNRFRRWSSTWGTRSASFWGHCRMRSGSSGWGGRWSGTNTSRTARTSSLPRSRRLDMCACSSGNAAAVRPCLPAPDRAPRSWRQPRSAVRLETRKSSRQADRSASSGWTTASTSPDGPNLSAMAHGFGRFLVLRRASRDNYCTPIGRVAFQLSVFK